jgi:hypothetical protein
VRHFRIQKKLKSFFWFKIKMDAGVYVKKGEARGKKRKITRPQKKKGEDLLASLLLEKKQKKHLFSQ